MPSVAPAAGAARTSGLGGGSRTMVLMVLVHAPATRRPASMDTDARLAKGHSSEKVGTNVVFDVMPRVGAPVQVGLIETMRVREGRVPWLPRHFARPQAALGALRKPGPHGGPPELVRLCPGFCDRGVRLQLTDGR